jgi:hypothetical protein
VAAAWSGRPRQRPHRAGHADPDRHPPQPWAARIPPAPVIGCGRQSRHHRLHAQAPGHPQRHPPRSPTIATRLTTNTVAHPSGRTDRGATAAVVDGAGRRRHLRPAGRQLDTSIYRIFGEVEVAGWRAGGEAVGCGWVRWCGGRRFGVSG